MYDWLPNTSYVYRVTASNEAGDSLNPAEVIVETPQRAIPRIAYVSDFFVQSGTEIRLFIEPVERANRYIAERQKQGESEWETVHDVTTQNSFELIDAAVKEDYYYSYRIIASNETGSAEPGQSLAILAYNSILYYNEEFDPEPSPYWIRLEGVTPKVIDGRHVLAFDGPEDRIAEIMGVPAKFESNLTFTVKFNQDTSTGIVDPFDFECHAIQNDRSTSFSANLGILIHPGNNQNYTTD
ncbi:MAG: hypothetical protein AAFX93_18945 [Verrucomicrobiota bacterium]